MRGDGPGTPLWAVGTMSGTSLDGVDAALVLTDGERILAFGPTAYRPYSTSEKDLLRAALGRWPGEDGGTHAAASALVEEAHAALLSPMGGDLVGFHGQTVAHEPRGRGTCQLGDGATLARHLGRDVVWDFRSADVAQGGQGAPLAPFYHFACARHAGSSGPEAFLNLGGVGNLTWVDPRRSGPEEAGACLAFDTGPANAPLDDSMRRRRGLDFDAGGALAREGRVDEGVIERLLAHPFFEELPPKSLDRDAFAWLQEATSPLSDSDAAATLTAAIVRSVARSLDHCPEMPRRLLVTGGGRHNRTLMDMLAVELPCAVAAVETIGLDGDMLEAQAFAFLAVRSLRALPLSAPGTTGVPVPMPGGVLSRPS